MIEEREFTLDTGLWGPQDRALRNVLEELDKGRDVCLQSPTGSGKTRMASELLRYAQHKDEGACFYVNRKLLIGQTAARLHDLEIPYGIRAADYEDCFDPCTNIQICSADTERSRVYGEDPPTRWMLHKSSIVIVDEAHIQKGDTMKRIIADHKRNGAQVVLLSATPVALAKMADVIVSGGTMQEYRDCGALVPAIVRTLEHPDLKKVKRNVTGEYVMSDRKRKIYTQSIVGNVIGSYKEYNPDGKPTMLYAPGKPESVWFCEQFQKAGINWAHVDATDAIVDGKRRTLNRTLWDEILERYISGDIKGISSRFKLREGVDVPSTYHVILATPIGSIQSYLQTVGRALRNAPCKDHALITDHGGNYLRHGSPNDDRSWPELWHLSSGVASRQHEDRIKRGELDEPIRCPSCAGERKRGPVCPHCGHEHTKTHRHVIQENGRMVLKEGDIVPRKRILKRPDTQAKWDRLYWAYKRKGTPRSFAQMEAFFVKEHHYWPPRNLNNMPVSSWDWTRKVADVPLNQLISDK